MAHNLWFFTDTCSVVLCGSLCLVLDTCSGLFFCWFPTVLGGSSAPSACRRTPATSIKTYSPEAPTRMTRSVPVRGWKKFSYFTAKNIVITTPGISTTTFGVGHSGYRGLWLIVGFNVIVGLGMDAQLSTRSRRAFSIEESWFPIEESWFPIEECWFPIEECWFYNVKGRLGVCWPAVII